MIWDPKSRRMFLQGSGKFLLSIPFLPSLLPREARAQMATPPSRYIAFCMDYGYGKHSQWYPSLDLPNKSLSGGGRYQSLSSYLDANGNLSPIFQNLLTPYLSMSNMIRGLDLPTHQPHSYGHRLGNYTDTLTGASRTIDQALNDSSVFNPGRSKDVTFLGYHRRPTGKDHGSYAQISPGVYRGVTAEIYQGNNVASNFTPNNPQQLFDRLFLGFQPPVNTSPGATMPVTTTTPHPRRDVLSRVIEDYKRVATSRKISSANKQTLENMADNLSDLMKNLNDTVTVENPQPVAAGSCSNSVSGITTTRVTYEDEVKMNRAFARVLAMAMTCDITRSAVVFSGSDPKRFYTLGGKIGVVGNPAYHADVTHFPFDKKQGGIEGYKHVLNYNRHNVKDFLIPLLEEMSAFRDPQNDKTILHNSLVHVNNEHALAHSKFTLPCLLIGKAGGRMKTGHYVDYTNRAAGPKNGSHTGGHSAIPGSPRFTYTYAGIPHKKLFATIGQAMNVPPSDYADITNLSPLNLPNADAA